MPGELLVCMQCMQKFQSGDSVCPFCGYPTSSKQEKPYLMQGLVLKGRYTVGKLLKKNIDSAVYIGYDIELNKVVEIREFFPISIAKREDDGVYIVGKGDFETHFSEYSRSFEQLWRNLMRFKGLPALCDVNDVFESNNTIYAVTEHEDSTTFRKILERMDIENNPMTFEKTCSLILSILSTVESLHTAGVIHRGISPETLLLSSNGKMKLTGFTIPQVRSTNNKICNSVFDGYSAIEQYDFNWQQGSWTDVYSIGAVIYKMLTGRTLKSAVLRLNDENVYFSKEDLAVIPQNVVSLIKNCLEIMPQGRIKDVRDIIDVMSGGSKDKKPVSVSSYSILSSRKDEPEEKLPTVYKKPKQVVAPFTVTIGNNQLDALMMGRILGVEVEKPPKSQGDELSEISEITEETVLDEADFEENSEGADDIVHLAEIVKPKQAKAPKPDDYSVVEKKQVNEETEIKDENGNSAKEFIKPKQAKAPILTDEIKSEGITQSEELHFEQSQAVSEKTFLPEIVKPKQAKAPTIINPQINEPVQEDEITEQSHQIQQIIVVNPKPVIPEIVKPKQAKAPDLTVRETQEDEEIELLEEENIPEQFIIKRNVPELEIVKPSQAQPVTKTIQPKIVIDEKELLLEKQKRIAEQEEHDRLIREKAEEEERLRLEEIERKKQEKEDQKREKREKKALAKELAKEKRQKSLATDYSDKTQKIADNAEDKTKKVAENPEDKIKNVAENVADKTKKVAEDVSDKTKKVVEGVADKTEAFIREKGKIIKRNRKNPVLTGVFVALFTAVFGLFLITVLYGTVLFKVFDAPVLDNCLSSFSVLPINKQITDETTHFVEVADFTDLTKEYIENDANFSKKYSFTFTYEYSKEAKSGHIFNQSVKEGEKVPEGTTIILYISKGVKMITMIDVSGKKYDEASAILSELGFKVEKEVEYNWGFHNQDEVITSSLKVGHKYEDGTAVTLKVWGEPLVASDTTDEATTVVTESTQPQENEPTTSEANEQPGLFDYIRQRFGF